MSKSVFIKITMIMPVYNASEYLRETLDSLAAQTLSEKELIAIDDGSTDDSLAILSEYAKQYSWIRVYAQKNQGPSAARNRALKTARGKYLYFGDADDLLEPDSFAAFFARAEEQQAELVIANYLVFNQYQSRVITNLNPILDLDEIDPYDTHILWTFSLSNKLFLHQAVKDYGLSFPATSYSEDGVFTMGFVYRCRKITGLNKVIFHYRRLEETRHASITSQVTLDRIRDYVASHELIFRSALEALQQRYPQLSDSHELWAQIPEADRYLDEIIRKELFTFFNSFYRKFWLIGDELIGEITEHIRTLLSRLNLRSYGRAVNAYRELPVDQLFERHSDVGEKDFLVTAVLYGEAGIWETDFWETVKSLCYQTFVPLAIVVPETMREFLQRQGVQNANIHYVESRDRAQFYENALKETPSPYLLICHSAFRYSTLSVLRLFQAIDGTDLDFVSDAVFMMTKNGFQPFYWYQQSLHEMSYGNVMDRTRLLNGYDGFWANKLIRRSFLNENGFLDGETGALELLPESVERLYRIGTYKTLATETIVLESYCARYPLGVMEMTDHSFSKNEDLQSLKTLHKKELSVTKVEMQQKHMFQPESLAKKSLPARMKFHLLQRVGLSSQVLFITSGNRGELYRNAALLKPCLKRCKVMFQRYQRDGQQDPDTRRKFVLALKTHRVIVCDDYVPLLQDIPLRPEQRVIQLWHEPGLPRMFGIYQNMRSSKREVASHVQYALMSVSSTDIRPYFAQAYDVRLEKVCALGCPYTDRFFDDEFCRRRIGLLRERYPALEGKERILCHIRKNMPDLEVLSSQLKENQLLLVPSGVGVHRENILEISDHPLEDLMLVSDRMVTDDSRSMFPYALLGKPMLYYSENIEPEPENTSFYLPHDFPGMYADNVHALIHLLTEDHFEIPPERFSTFRKVYLSACDGHSTERIAALINQYLEER